MNDTNLAFEYDMIINHLKKIQVQGTKKLYDLIDKYLYSKNNFGLILASKLTNEDNLVMTTAMNKILACSNSDQINVPNIMDDIGNINEILINYDL